MYDPKVNPAQRVKSPFLAKQIEKHVAVASVIHVSRCRPSFSECKRYSNHDGASNGGYKHARDRLEELCGQFKKDHFALGVPGLQLQSATKHFREDESKSIMPVSRHIMDQLKKLIPPLDGSLHKGQSGRVGVMGGALDYTGAPFFAAISALRLGADLSHVICSPTAASAIKSYSPDLIVHPILREESSTEKVRPELDSLFSRLHVLILGPGLGREEYMQSFARLALSIARSRGMFVVLDADALWMAGQDISVIKGYRRAIVTPNVMEFKRLSEQVGIDPSTPPEKRAELVSRALGGVTVLQKGPKDIIAVDTTGNEANLEMSKIGGADEEREMAREVIEVDVEGGLKRCGGQGDILSGVVGTMLAWGKCFEDGAFGDKSIPASRIPILAAVGGSMVTRTASRRAFYKEGRGVVTQDMLPEVGNSFREVFGEDVQGRDRGKL